MTFLNVTICTYSILAAICATEHQKATEVASWRGVSFSAELVLLCSVSLQVGSLYPLNIDATSKVLGLAGVSLCASVRDDVSVAPLLFAHPHFFCAHV